MGGSRDVTELIILASESRTSGETVSRDIVNPGYKGGHFIWQMSTNTKSTGTTAFVTSMKIQGKIPGTTNYYDVAVFTNTTSATGGVITKRVALYPGLSTASTLANEVRSDLLPHVFRVRSTMSTSTGAADHSGTYSVTCTLFD